MPSDPGTFSAPYDRTTKIVTLIVCLVLLLPALATRNPLVYGLAVLVAVIGYAYSPRGYVVSPESILIQRLAGNVRLPVHDIHGVRAATPADFRGCIRLWGSGGLFGYYGLFRTPTLGKCTWYVTDRSKAVIVTSAAKTVLFSPEDVDGFIAAIRAFAPIQELPAGEPLYDTGGSNRSRRALALVATAVGAAGITLAILAGTYSPGPPGYTLTRDSLTIHDRSHPVTLQAAAVDVAQVRVVDISEESDWRPVRRTRGFSNAHYQSGWFRVAGGQNVRLYRAGGQRLVLLPGRGDNAAVLYQAKDPQQFIQQLRQEWSGQP